jgi:hypothetical protein
LPGRFGVFHDMTENDFQNSCSGYCRRCGTSHTLPQGNARLKAGELIKFLEEGKTLAISETSNSSDPRLSTAPLFQSARGKMFGVLEGLTKDGSIVWLYSFSGQYSGHWKIPGWVSPLFDVQSFRTLNDPVEQQIKNLGQQIEAEPPATELRELLQHQRRELARALMKDIHALYRLNNFCGEEAGLASVIGTTGGIPTGTGDCCAPKLLNQAALAGLAPLSLAEFYFGRENRSQTRQHGRFYAPCTDKCSPLLGFMLCGAAEQRDLYGG